MRRRFLKVLASFWKNQNGGKSHVTVKVFIDESGYTYATDATQKNSALLDPQKYEQYITSGFSLIQNGRRST